MRQSCMTGGVLGVWLCTLLAVTGAGAEVVLESSHFGSGGGVIQTASYTMRTSGGIPAAGNTVSVSYLMHVGVFTPPSFIPTHYVADFTRDGHIDGDDLLAFLDAWRMQDVAKEIGPAMGIPPNLLVTPDGIVDFEDLTVFAWMWNWDRRSAADKPATWKSAPQASAATVAVSIDGDGSLTFTSADRPDFLHIRIPPQPGVPQRYTATKTNYWADGDRGFMLTKQYDDGTFELAAILFEPMYAPAAAPRELVVIEPSRATDSPVHVEIAVRETGTAAPAAETLTLNPDADTPGLFRVHQNAPNPFNPSTMISFTLPEETHATVSVYNLAGQEVAVLKDGLLAAGDHAVTWRADGMPSGVYVCRITAGGNTRTRKMLLMK